MDKLLTLIIPIYNESESLTPLIELCIQNIANLIIKKQITDYEILCINDGSTDNSEYVLKNLQKKYEKIKIFSFDKNLGKAHALQVGFESANGYYVCTIDADLQDDPNELKRFLEKIEEGFDLVSGWKYKRNDPFEKRIPSKLFNKVVSFSFNIDLHDFNCGFKMYKKDVVKKLKIFGGLHRFIPVLASQYGYKIGEIKVHHNKREFGKSKYGWGRYVKGFLDFMAIYFFIKFQNKIKCRKLYYIIFLTTLFLGILSFYAPFYISVILLILIIILLMLADRIKSLDDFECHKHV